MDLLYHSAKVFATGTADRKFCIFEKNRHCARDAAHPTSENGKLAALTSGRPSFREHAKRTEGSDTTPRLARSESAAHRVKKQQHHQIANRSRSPAGPRRLGTATRISASLSRRPSAFFESTSRPRSQSGKTCRSDTRPGDVGERAERSESSDTTPIRNAPCFGVQAAVCDPLSKGECVPAFTRESERGPFVRGVEKCAKKRFGTAL